MPSLECYLVLKMPSITTKVSDELILARVRDRMEFRDQRSRCSHDLELRRIAPARAVRSLKILLDQSTPRNLARLLPRHDVKHTAQLGWEEGVNGELLTLAEDKGYKLLITADQNIPYQIQWRAG